MNGAGKYSEAPNVSHPGGYGRAVVEAQLPQERGIDQLGIAKVLSQRGGKARQQA